MPRRTQRRKTMCETKKIIARKRDGEKDLTLLSALVFIAEPTFSNIFPYMCIKQ